MLTHTRAALIPILDRFLEAQANVTKWRALTPVSRETARKVAVVFRDQGDRLLKATDAKAREGSRLVWHAPTNTVLRETATPDFWETEWDTVATDTAPDLIDVIQTAAEIGLTIGAEMLIAELAAGTAFDLKNPRAVAYLETHGAEWVAGINDTTKSRLRTLLAQGAREGLSYTEIANQIDTMFTDFSRTSVVDFLLDRQKWSRAEIVAITELGNAYEAGNAIVAADLMAAGLVMEKRWLSVRDGEVDTTLCKPNDEQGWIPETDAFQSGHMQPLAHPLCRCTTLRRRKPKK
jgi:hypothetical protein